MFLWPGTLTKDTPCKRCRSSITSGVFGDLLCAQPKGIQGQNMVQGCITVNKSSCLHIIKLRDILNIRDKLEKRIRGERLVAKHSDTLMLVLENKEDWNV